MFAVNRQIFVIGIFTVLALVLAACAPAATPLPATPTPEAMVFEPLSLSTDCAAYPEGSAGLFQTIEALDQFTVRFTLCRPDPAFLSKLSFGSVFSIYPQEWLEATVDNPAERLEHPIGTGPYQISDWAFGESVTFTRFEDYWGEPAQTDTLIFRWATESAARTLELQAGTVDGIDSPGPDDFAVIEGDPNLQLIPRPALNVFYIGFTNTFEPFDDVLVRQAIAIGGIDAQRIVDTFYPRGSEVASHFTPCAIPNGCAGDAWYEFDPDAGRALLAEAGFPDGFSTNIFYRDVVRGYLPEVARVAEEIQAQLLANLNIDATIVPMESGAFIEACTTGQCDGIHLLGWTADYPHVTNFLDFHFGGGILQFGTPHPEIYEALEQGGQIADPAEAEPFYVEANNAIRELVPMVPVAHGGSGVAYQADVVGGQASPLNEEVFFPMDPGGRDTFVFMQNAEPISLFCADETDGESIRACGQVLEGLYAYDPPGGLGFAPALATSCDPNEDLSVWTCTLRQGVKFHDGSDFDANDVVATFTMGLDASSPLHVGNSNAWEYYTSLWGLMNVPPE